MATRSLATSTKRTNLILFVGTELAAADFRSGATYHNLPAEDDVIVNLPANPASGTTVTIASTTDTKFITIQPDGSDSILYAGKGPGDTIRIDVAGANVELVADGANGWVVTAMGGIWV